MCMDSAQWVEQLWPDVRNVTTSGELWCCALQNALQAYSLQSPRIPGLLPPFSPFMPFSSLSVS